MERVGSVRLPKNIVDFDYDCEQFTVKLNIFFGSLLWTDDHAEVKLSMDCCEMIERTNPER